ncbi:MAG TPA: IPExxxVDY family protein [Chitinophagaceae bacterium]|nr:IPExxxVDY family protein [Chitinophagaceae bacterium]
MSASLFRLNNDSVSDQFLDDSRLIGMVTPMKDYQLCWEINQALRFDFRLEPDLEIQLKKGRKTIFFNVFRYQETMKSVIHYLFNNHFRAEFLLPELKHFDCLWLVKGDYYLTGELKLLLERVREIGSVRLVSELSLEEVKNRQNLILE